MGESLFSDNTKSFLSNELDNVAKSFERPILISLEAQKATVYTNENFNRFQANDLNLVDQNPINIPIIYTGMARVLYDKQQPIPLTNPYVGGNRDDTQLKLQNQEGKVRIKIAPSGGQLLANAKLVELDGIIFHLDGVPRPHGLFRPDYWTIVLKREK